MIQDTICRTNCRCLSLSILLCLVTAAFFVAPAFAFEEPALDIGARIKKQQTFLNHLDKYYYTAKVQAAVDSVVKLGDDFAGHREFLGLAHRTTYLPYLRQFQFLFFRSGREEEGCWRLEILVDEQLRVQRVLVSEVKD